MDNIIIQFGSLMLLRQKMCVTRKGIVVPLFNQASHHENVSCA